MNIAFDISILKSVHKDRGLGKHAEYLIAALQNELSSDDKLYLLEFLDHEHYEKFENLERIKIYIGECKAKDYGIKEWAFANDELKYLSTLSIEKALIENDIDIVIIFNHTVIPFNYAKEIKKNNKHIKFIVAIQDLIPAIFPDIYLRIDVLKNDFYRTVEILKDADLLLANSESAKNDTNKLLNISREKIFVTYLGSTVEPNNENKLIASEVLSKYNISKKYLMYTGGDDWRKNIVGLINAFAKCNSTVLKQFELVIVCNINNRKAYEDIIESCGLNGKVILTGYVSNDELDIIYKSAYGLIFPSLYEGFGLPILEAMKYSLPVAVANASSMPEVISEKGLLFEPSNPDSMANAINILLTDGDERERLIKLSIEREKLFSWQNCAIDTIKAIKTLKLEKQTIDNKRYKIAMLSPMPPEGSGISDYTFERLNAWKKYFDIDIFTKEPNNIEGFNIYQYSEFEKKHSDYQLAIYQMGNSYFHTEIFAYLEKYNGIVVIHDYNLSGLFFHLQYSGVMNENTIIRNTYIQYENDYRAKYNEIIANNFRGVDLNRFVTANALGVIVHSKFAKDNLLKYNVNLPITITPIASIDYPTKLDIKVKNQLKKKYNISDNDFIIGTFGYISPAKRVFELIDVFASYLANNVDKKSSMKLLLVGEAHDKTHFENYCNDIKNKYGVHNNIIYTGRTDIEEFSNLMYIPNIVFNLRYPTNGESSGSLARLMMIGKPVVVTNIPTFSELPDNTCIKIRYDENEKDDMLDIITSSINNLDLLNELSKNAREYMLKECNVDINAKGYLKAIQKYFKKTSTKCIETNELFYKKLKKNIDESFYTSHLPSIAEFIFRLQNKPEKTNLTILFDAAIFIEVFIQKAHRSGIYLVALNILLEFLKRDKIKTYLYCKDCDKEKIESVLIDELPIELIGRVDFFDGDMSAIDTFFSPVFIFPEHIANLNIKKFILLYDALPITNPEFFNNVKPETTWNYKIIKGIQEDDICFSISKNTINDYIKCGIKCKKENMIVTYLAASDLFYPCTNVEVLEQVKLKYNIPRDKKFIFSLCSIEPRKNLNFIIECFLQFISENDINDLIFVLGGASWDSFIKQFEEKMGSFERYKDKIIRIGYVDDKDLATLYSNSLFFTYISHYEGFGLPPLEAMQCGTPVITANNSSIPEVMGDVGLLVDSKNKTEIISAMKKYYFDDDFRNKQIELGIDRAKKFSWKETTDIIIEKMYGSIEKS